MKVAIYARVSTKDKGQNPEMQLEPLRKFCVAMDWQIFKEYVDKAKSGDLIGRKRWTELLADASLHKFDILLIWKLDRAFRSNQHASTTLNTLNSYKVAFRSLMDPGIDTTTPNGQLLFNILASFAQFERDLIVMRVNEGLDYAREHGTKSGKPIGRVGLDISTLEIQTIYSENKSYSETARIISKRLRKKVSPGFVASRIKRALQNVGKANTKNEAQNSDNIQPLANQLVCQGEK